MNQQQSYDRPNHDQMFVYFPIAPTCKSGFIYGVVKPNENYYNCLNVYVTSFEEKTQLVLLGTWNTNQPRPNEQSTWIQLTTETTCAQIENVLVDGVKVPLPHVALVLYDQSFLQSEILQFNDNWNSSKCLDSVANNSHVVKQFRQRALQWKAWKRASSEMASFNLLLMMLLDLFLGFCFASFFHSLGGPNQVLEIFLDLVKVIADNLQLLVENLMGVPVGLKLNRPLSTVLGKFFLYHLYLWITYIDIIKPVISIIILISSTIGLIGLSFQLALLNDLITMASLHCYCFYVYAARLYGVTLHGLRSTLRMFGGRKWNPLRSRIDSGQFTWDQLCVGMFIFSSLLLLLPTLFVYYIVFLSLRLGVLFLQGTLKRLIWLINSFPMYSLLLWFLGSPLLAGDVKFETIPGRDSTLKLVCIKLPLILSIKRSLNPSAPDYPSINWTQRLNQIVSGDLINPF
uniref:EOG090X0BA1 n=1 Tax=Megafenestra aurita TaxID=2291010 RepID=A0A4Y7NHA7_9CRUS|nr:EOG090X0BA1 [Megafenestra aurita]